MTNGFSLIFSGQGSQKPQMGLSLFSGYQEAKEVFLEADAALSIFLSKKMFTGTLEELSQTEITQPAILTYQIALLRVLQKRFSFSPKYCLGHSLGEYSALVAAGVMSFTEALKAVRFRGKVMQEASVKAGGAMAAILSLSPSLVEQACLSVSHDGNYVTVANYNGPMQTVVSGTKKGVAKVANLCKGLGAKRVINLNVSVPFHSELMKKASLEMISYLQCHEFLDAKFPVINNVDAKAHISATMIKSNLLKQVMSSVKFTQSLEELLKRDATLLLELGPLTILGPIAKRVSKKFNVWSYERDGLPSLDRILNGAES